MIMTGEGKDSVFRPVIELDGLRSFISTINTASSIEEIEELGVVITSAMDSLSQSDPEKAEQLFGVYDTLIKFLYHKKQQFIHSDLTQRIREIGFQGGTLNKIFDSNQVDSRAHNIAAAFENSERSVFLGEGAEAVVRAVYDAELDAIFACKRNRKDDDGQTSKLHRLKKEYDISKRIDHPNIAKTYSFVESNGVGTMISEYIQGRDLDLALFEDWEDLSSDKIVLLLTQYASAISYLHDNSVLNDDLSIQNVSYEDGTIKLFDFGLASQVDFSSNFGRNRLLNQTKKIAEVFIDITCGGRTITGIHPPFKSMLSAGNYDLCLEKLGEDKVAKLEELLANIIGVRKQTMLPKEFMNRYIEVLTS